MVRLCADPEVARWQWPGELGGARTPEQSRTFLLAQIHHWERHGFGQWFWRERASGELVGRAGLTTTETWQARVTSEALVAPPAPGERLVEVSWSFSSTAKGHGYATEAARAAIEHGFDELGIDEVVGFTWTRNTDSLRVIEKLGLRPDGGLTYAGLPHLLFRATRR